MELLSNDILIECILSLCDPRTIARFSQTCKRFNALCKSNRVWDPLLPQHLMGRRTAPFQELRKRLHMIKLRFAMADYSDCWFDILFRDTQHEMYAGLLFPECKRWNVVDINTIEIPFDSGNTLLLQRNEIYYYNFQVNGQLLQINQEFMHFANRIFSVRATPEWICRRENNLIMWAFKQKKKV